jgi:hypothetical protein
MQGEVQYRSTLLALELQKFLLALKREKLSMEKQLMSQDKVDTALKEALEYVVRGR